MLKEVEGPSERIDPSRLMSWAKKSEGGEKTDETLCNHGGDHEYICHSHTRQPLPIGLLHAYACSVRKVVA